MFAADASGVWLHYASTVCSPGYVINAGCTFMSAVALCASVIGVARVAAERHDFPLRAFRLGAAAVADGDAGLRGGVRLTDYLSSAGRCKAGCGRRLAGEGRLLVP